MSFLHPALLAFGLACVSIPILIHFLLRRRRPPVKWAAMRFVLEAYRKRRRRMKLEQLLLLCARCLLVALLAAAIAVPVVGRAESSSGRSGLLVILIDDSIASGARTGEGTTLDGLRAQAARALDDAHPERGERVALVSMGAPARVIMQPTRDVQLARAALGELTPTDAPIDLAGAAELARQLARGPDDRPNAASARALVLAAWRDTLGAAARESLALTGLAPVRVAGPATGVLDNAALTELEPDRRVVAATGQQTLVSVRAAVERTRSDADDPLVMPIGVVVRRVADGEIVASASGTVSFDAGQARTELTLPLALGADELGSFVIEGAIRPASDALDADDTRRAAIEVRPPLRVAVFGERASGREGVDAFTPTDWIVAALSPSAGSLASPGAERVGEGVTPVPRSIASLGRTGPIAFDAVVLTDPGSLDSRGWARLREHVDGAGVLIIAPSPGASAHAWGATLADLFDAPLAIGRSADVPDAPFGLRPGPEAGTLLARLSGELDELTRPVSVSRRLPIELSDTATNTQDAGQSGATDRERGEPPASTTARPASRTTLHATGARVVLETSDGSPWLVAWSPSHAQGSRAGVVVVVASAIVPGWTDLPARPLMVPLMHELVQRAVGDASPRTEHVAGKTPPPLAGAVRARTRPTGFARRGDAEEASPDTPLRFAGVAVAVDDEGAPVGTIVTNPSADPRVAQPLPVDDYDQLLASLGPASAVARVGEEPARTGGIGQRGRRIVVVLLACVLALLAAEALLGRSASHASLDQRAKPRSIASRLLARDRGSAAGGGA